ncbi:MAG TPA: hypothetical protein VF017_05000 [Thermoanaerobaculia bacterium]|nr:hypothetical protein [Thermoanaerobaculia bacterium]
MQASTEVKWTTRSPRRLAGALLALVLAATAAAPARAGEAERIAELEKQVAALKAEVAALKSATAQGAPPAVAEIERKIEVLAQEIERIKLGEAAVEADRSDWGLGPAASKIYRKAQGVSIGGYGEMLYQGFDDTRDDGARSGRTDELDFLRAVFYFGYKFDSKWLFNSEVEYEHASTGEGGEVSVEFAYLDYLHRPELNFRAGMVLLPVGFVNELHEPTVYLGAKRPDVERVILPTTWRENGLGLFGDVGDFSYRAYLVNGMDASGFTASGIRGGRQKGALAKAEDLALVARLDWHGVPGLTVGASAYRGDSGQGLTTAAGAGIDATTTILEGHAEWRYRGLELRGLWVKAEIDDVAALNARLGLSGANSVGEELSGTYLQAGWDVLSVFGSGQAALIPYARWETFDTQSAVPAGFLRGAARDVESLTVGVAWKPIDRIVFKADYQDYDNGAGTGVDQVNVALGYTF